MNHPGNAASASAAQGTTALRPAFAPTCPDCERELEVHVERFEDGSEDVGACRYCNSVWGLA